MVRAFMLLLSVLFLLYACAGVTKPAAAKSKSTVPDAVLEINKNGEAENRIVYLTFEMRLTDSLQDRYTFKLKHKILAAGTLKKNPFPPVQAFDPAFLYYEVSSVPSAGKNLVKIQNPLYATYEYPNDDGNLSRKTIPQKTGELTIRFQFDNGLKYLSIYKPQQNSSTLKKIFHAVL